jgi:VanZ family protein
MSLNQNNSYSKKSALLTVIALICFVLFFVGGPDYYSPRSYKYLWDLGHILFFSILSYLILLNWPKCSETTFLRQSIFIIFIVICLGGLVELAQTGSVRTPDIMDLIRDIIGGLVALSFWAPARNTISKARLRMWQAISATLVAMAFLPLTTAVLDERKALKQFPVLSDFESRFEIDRWTGDADFSIDHETYYHGKASLKVELNTSLYSGVGLKYFPKNWQHYNELQLSIFNPDSEPIKLTCRIHDRQHTRGLQLYADRFNRKFSISTRWSLIRIQLKEIENTPHKRKMALNKIQEIGIFAVSLQKPRAVYVDYVRLVD